MLLQFTKLPKTFSCKGKEYPFLFLSDMPNTQPLHPAVHSLCAVQMQHFMK